MYEHFQPSERIFVDREEHLTWMDEALKRCKEKSIVMHLRGIGGIGKSSLLEYWNKSIERSIRLDCQQHSEYYSRLDIIAKRAVRLGISLQRFDLLWHIRKRFVEGVEPAQETGREWAKDILSAIPFIGSLLEIGAAISSIGKRVAPKIMGRYREVGDWLQKRLGKDYIEELLEVLWKEPRHAEFLYLDALLEDLNSRKNVDQPLLIVLDAFENVDDENLKWTYRERKIAEAELWYVFLSSLSNAVSVIATRKTLSKNLDKNLVIEEVELTELDPESCIEFLSERKITEESVQQQIIQISSGNPFVMDAICDMIAMGSTTNGDLDKLRANTLEEVRLRTWRRLFSHAKELLSIVERAGLLPSFDRNMLSVIVPTMRTDQWERFIRLSFVKDLGDGNWTLHNLAQDLVLTELSDRLEPITREVSDLLEDAFTRTNDYSLLGLSLSVRALTSEEQAFSKARETINDLRDEMYLDEALHLMQYLDFKSRRGQVEIQGLRGKILLDLKRYTEAELELQEAQKILRIPTQTDDDERLAALAVNLRDCASIYTHTIRFDDAESLSKEAIEILRNLVHMHPEKYREELAYTLALGSWQFRRSNVQQAEDLVDEAIRIYEDLPESIRERYQRRYRHALLLRAVVMSHLDLSRRSDCMSAHRHAYDIQRKACETAPESVYERKNLIIIINNFGGILRQQGNYSEEIELLNEGISIARILIKERGSFYQQYLASSLCELGSTLLLCRNPLEANPILKESISIFESVFEKEPEVWGDWLAGGYLGMTLIHLEFGRVDDSKDLILKMIEISRRRMETAKLTHSAYFGLYAYAFILDATAKSDEAEREYRESLEHFEQHPRNELFKTLNAAVLNNYGVLLLKKKKLSMAKKTMLEAIELLDEEVHSHLMSQILNNLGIVSRHEGEYEDAESIFQSSITFIGRRLAYSPVFEFHKATTLTNFALLLKETERIGQAEEYLREAIDIKRRFSEYSPLPNLPSVGRALNNLGVLLIEADRLSEAEEALLESLKIRRELAEISPDQYHLLLGPALNNLGILLERTGRLDEAEQVFGEAFEIDSSLTSKTLVVEDDYAYILDYC